VLVFKVMNKMFALTGLEGDPPTVNLKCDPERAIELREQYEVIQPGYHMNKVIDSF
jgi:predicted DNA-binding protein (MmcQ/YjbR family)